MGTRENLANQGIGRLEELLDFCGLAEIHGEELRIRLELQTFCQTLVRALLQSSYYSPDHPQARTVVDEPFSLMSRLASRWVELTFAIDSPDESSGEMMLEGVFREPVPLASLIGGAAGEHFSRKLREFSDRHRLISFSVPTSMPQDEFHRFVSSFVEIHVDAEALTRHHPREAARAKPHSLAEALARRHVTAVQLVSQQDLVTRDRRLPWRVRVSLSRLQKDLRRIPLYSNASNVELRRLKLRLLKDILRPLGRPAYLAEFFLNLDLLSEAVAELADEDVEEDMISLLPVRQVIGLGTVLLAESNRNWWDEGMDARPPDAEARLKRQLELIALRLSDGPDLPAASTLLKELYRTQHVRFATLPERIRSELEVERMVDACHSHPIGFMARFDEIDNAADYVDYLRDSLMVFPYLLERRAYIVAELIIQTLTRHGTEPEPFHGRKAALADALSDLESPTTLALFDEFTDGAPQARHYVRQLLVPFGESAIPILMLTLEVTDNPGVRRDVCDALASLGDIGARAARDRLADHNTSTEMTCTLLEALGELHDTKATFALQHHAQHKQAEIRQAALSALATVHGAKVGALIRGALSDPNPGVVTRAIEIHSAFEPRNRDFLQALVDALMNTPNAAGRTPDPTVRLSAIKALSNLGNIRLSSTTTLESLLLRSLGPPPKRKLRHVFRRDELDPERELKVAVWKGLGRIGGEQALDRLNETAQEPDLVIRQTMSASQAAIEKRLAPPAD